MLRLFSAVAVLSLLPSAPPPPRPAPPLGLTYPKTMIEIKEVSESDLAPALKALRAAADRGDKTVMFRINSFGGSVFEGLDFVQEVEQVQKAKGVRVICVADTKAMSMGFYFLQSFCDVRLMTTRAILLAHNASVRGNQGGTAHDLDDVAQFLRALDASLRAIIAERMGMTPEEYDARVLGKDWTFASAEALRVNAVDAVVDARTLPPVGGASAFDRMKKALGF